MNYLYDSPFGGLTLQIESGRCLRLSFLSVGSAPVPEPFKGWLDGYFAGLPEQPMVPLAAPFSDFQGRLRTALWAIPRGQTLTYGQLASQLGSSSRAVGQSLHANPLPIFVPCHRVVSRAGEGGFAGGLEWKRLLLALEQDR